MIKTKSNLLIFDKHDKIGNIFPKECIVTIPEFVPVTNFNSSGPDNFESIGKVISHNRDGSKIEIETEIICKDEVILEKLIIDGKVYSGGYYKINKAHREEDGVLILDNIKLKSVGLYFGDVYGNNDLRMEMEE